MAMQTLVGDTKEAVQVLSVMSDNSAIAENIAAARKRLDPVPSQTAIAERLGVARSTYAAWERGDQTIPATALPALCRELRVSPLRVLGMLDEPGVVPAGIVLADIERVKRILGTEDGSQLAREFDTKPPEVAGWNVIVPPGAQLITQEKAAAYADILNPHLIRCAGKEMQANLRRRFGAKWDLSDG